jgi:hypothetical protein
LLHCICRLLARCDRYCSASECRLSGGGFNRSTQHLEQLAINNDDGLPNRSPKCCQRVPPQPAIPIAGFALPPSYHHEISDLSANNRSLPSKGNCCVDRLRPPGNCGSTSRAFKVKRLTRCGSGMCIAAVEGECLIGYSIASSARASNAGGTVKPRAVAAFKLITNSNLTGAWTGSSLGFAPLRTRSTYVAARRKLSVSSTP